MEGEEAARNGLAHLDSQRAAGAVIALRSPGPLAADPVAGPARPWPEGSVPLRSHVRSAHPAVNELLDRLLAHAVVVEGAWEAAVELAMGWPELVIVSRAGDRCAGGIWRTGAHGSGATGAALEEALEALRDATSAAERAAATEVHAKADLKQARLAASDAQRRAAGNAADAWAARETAGRARADLAEADREAQALSSQQDELTARRGF